jgi:Flp pilus assembly pilin Flp
MLNVFVRLIRDESGQDIIEYALLGAFIATVGIVAWESVGVKIQAAYTGWDSGVQNLSSCTPNPIASGGGGC